MAIRLRKLLDLGSNSSKYQNIVGSNEYHMPINYSNWTIPKENIENIYKVGSTDFKVAFSIKTHEETLSINQEYQSIPLFNQSTINKYIKRNYRYIHIGLVQVAVKPLV